MKVIKTGLDNFDTILGGGFPSYSLNFVIGSPGTGKTILIQNFFFISIP
ncbi:MAG: hypothetical protein H7644_14420 [Candidatus Heimdallarchaeota archaeon]|nr:hypothetical protein [Candidatus Heimdallarchaeota archaeon]MCK5144958.1 hypothetical protein [Candidatus Heimdallarchaeota archaeon]